MRKTVRTIHWHGKSEDAFLGSPDDEIRRFRLRIAVYDGNCRIGRVVGPCVAVFVAKDAIQLYHHRLGADGETHRSASRRRAHLGELVYDERGLRLVRVAGEEHAPSVAPNRQDVVVARVVVDLGRVLVAGTRPAERRMDDMRDACHDLRNRQAIRCKHLGRRGVRRAPISRDLVGRALELGSIPSKDAVDRIYGRIDGKRRSLCGVAGLVAGKRAREEIHHFAVDRIDGAAMSRCRIAAECRIDEERGIAVPLQSQRAAMIGGIARKGGRRHQEIVGGLCHEADRAAVVGRLVAEKRAVVDGYTRAAKEKRSSVVRPAARKRQVREREHASVVRGSTLEVEVPRIRTRDKLDALLPGHEFAESIDLERPRARRYRDFACELDYSVRRVELLEGHAPASVFADEEWICDERVDRVAQRDCFIAVNVERARAVAGRRDGENV